jgi:hypothetical protein
VAHDSQETTFLKCDNIQYVCARGHTSETFVRWEAPYPNIACKPNNLENSNIEQLWALNQPFSKISVVLVVAISCVWFRASMTFCVLSMLTSKGLEAIFQAFLKFGQAIMDVIFVQKSQNFGEHVV